MKNLILTSQLGAINMQQTGDARSVIFSQVENNKPICHFRQQCIMMAFMMAA